MSEQSQVSQSKQAWRRHVSIYRGASLTGLQNAETSLTVLLQKIGLNDPRYGELKAIEKETEALRKRLLRVNLPQI